MGAKYFLPVQRIDHCFLKKYVCTHNGALRLNIFDFGAGSRLPEGQADELLKIHELAQREIGEEISPLDKEGLISEKPYYAPGLRIFMLYRDDEIVGYGIGVTDMGHRNEIYYIELIYVCVGERRTNSASIILSTMLINVMANSHSIKYFSAITQDGNDGAIALLNKFGFSNDIKTLINLGRGKSSVWKTLLNSVCRVVNYLHLNILSK